MTQHNFSLANIRNKSKSIISPLEVIGPSQPLVCMTYESLASYHVLIFPIPDLWVRSQG